MDVRTQRFAAGLTAAALLLALLPGLAAAWLEPQPPDDDPEPIGVTVVEPGLPQPSAEDLGPASFTAAPISDTIRLALDDYERRAALQIAELAETQDMAIPERNTRIALPLVVVPAAPAATPTPRPEPGAEVSVTLWAEPSIRVGRGATVTYDLRIFNDGRGDARRVTVRLPYNSAHLQLIASRLDRNAGDWVSQVTASEVTVTFGGLENERARNGLLTFRVAGGLPDNTVLDMRPSFAWHDARGTHDARGNWAPVLVGGGNDSAAYVWTIVRPVDDLGTALRTFYSNRFVPGERVVAWLNTPTEVRPLDLATTVDLQGQMWLEYRPTGLAPGGYQLVVYGMRSRLTGVASFVVR